MKRFFQLVKKFIKNMNDEAYGNHSIETLAKNIVDEYLVLCPLGKNRARMFLSIIKTTHPISRKKPTILRHIKLMIDDVRNQKHFVNESTDTKEDLIDMLERLKEALEAAKRHEGEMIGKRTKKETIERLEHAIQVLTQQLSQYE